VRLTSELTSLEEPTDDPDIVILSALLADGPDLKGELNPKVRRRSSNFRSSAPSLDFRRLLDCYWLKVKKPSKS
jgi:hypothetical protein